MKNLIGILIGAVCVICIIGSTLVPSVNDILVTAGDEITLTNTTSIVLRETEPGDVLKCTSVYDTDSSSHTDTWTLNDEEITSLSGSAATWNVGLMSDAIYLQIYASSNSAAGILYSMSSSTPSAIYLGGANSSNTERTYSFSFGDSAITYDYSDSLSVTSSATYDYTWAYSICPYADGEYCAAVSGGVGYVSDPDEVILSGAYTTGDFDTMYYYKDGVSYVSNTSYSMTADIDTEVTEGTTDIYTATVSVDVSDGTDTESFTPYRILIPYEVSGHATSGVNYALYSMIPILTVMAFVIAFVFTVTKGREY